jgi:glycosyltransferase involved in cell wall biosynthesis
MQGRLLKVLHGPANVGNQPWVLSRAERSLGLRSDVVQNYGTWIGYPADKTLGVYGKKSLVTVVKRIVFALSAPFRYDTIHYSFGFMLWDDLGLTLGRNSLLDQVALLDVHIARKLGRPLFMTLQGCDARQASASSRINDITMCKAGACPAYSACIKSIDQSRRAMVDTLLPLMDRVFFLNPELGRMLFGKARRADFLPYANFDPYSVTVSLPKTDRRLRIIHAPSNKGIKGTDLILNALELLKPEIEFELVLVENLPHTEALKLYASADLAIDQVLAGWYGGFAVEMMAMGKPVAAYIRDADQTMVPAALWADLPILRISPETLVEDLRQILSRPGVLREAGRRARSFVERWHNPTTIATAMLRLYRDPNAELVI